MNRFPVWKNSLIALVIVLAGLFALPNVFGESPAIQVLPARAGVPIDSGILTTATDAAQQAGLNPTGGALEGNGLKVRFNDTEAQLKAKDVIQAKLGDSYVVALNLIPNSPAWLGHVGASPMFLGLDLRGGVHFLLQVDGKAVLQQSLDHGLNEWKTVMRDKGVYAESSGRDGNSIVLHFRDAAAKDKGRDALGGMKAAWLMEDVADDQLALKGTLLPETLKQNDDAAVQQNILIMRNRINELGVAEPIIQRQGVDRIVVELPGVQDTAKAKEILGRTASLEVHLVNDDVTTPGITQELVRDRDGRAMVIQRLAILTGRNIVGAKAGFTQTANLPTVDLTLDSTGARIFQQVTHDNVGKRIAIVQVEKGKSVVLTAPVVREEIPGGQVQISGHMSVEEASETALLVRAGSLAAPMEIIEERTLGPSLGKDNIARGVNAVIYGFVAIAVFMSVYYRLFGVISVVALGINLILLIAVLSMLQATLTLPGMAGIALTVGMAIDANVLINERIREELRHARAPQIAIRVGYELAFGTILDSNVTTFVVGMALFSFGSGPVRGFAAVLCLGILTSMFSAILVSRACVNLMFGSRRKLTTLPV